MSSPVPIFPTLRGLGWSVKWTPQFFNMPSSIAADGSSIDLALASAPLHQFDLTYDALVDTGEVVGSPFFLEFQQIMGFYMSMQGTVGRFGFSLPQYNNLGGQLVGVGDGTTTSFQIPLFFGTGNGAGNEPIGVFDNFTGAPFHLFDNGVPVPYTGGGYAYTLNITTPCNQLINFTGGPPAAGHALTMDGNFLFYCRFAENSIEFENFAYKRWMASKVSLMTCRKGA